MQYADLENDVATISRKTRVVLHLESVKGKVQIHRNSSKGRFNVSPRLPLGEMPRWMDGLKAGTSLVIDSFFDHEQSKKDRAEFDRMEEQEAKSGS